MRGRVAFPSATPGDTLVVRFYRCAPSCQYVDFFWLYGPYTDYTHLARADTTTPLVWGFTRGSLRQGRDSVVLRPPWGETTVVTLPPL